MKKEEPEEKKGRALGDAEEKERINRHSE